MSEKKKEAPKTTEKSNPTYQVADTLLAELDRVHMRIPKF